jgi:rhodanese-related sulfurtransferase
MKILREIIAIISVSFISGLGFNAFSPHGINVLNNPWSRNVVNDSTYQVENGNQLVNEDPIIFVGFDRSCQFIENKEGIVLDARAPEAYAEGHIPGAHHLFFYNMSEYYPKHKDLLKESPAILVYCGDINCEDSEFLANELFNLGHAPILVYKGGLEDWKSHQGCIETGKEKDECW